MIKTNPRNILFSFIFILFFFQTLELLALTTPVVRICMTGSLMKIYPEYARAFEQGAESALDDLKKNNLDTQFEKHIYYYDNNPLAPRQTLEKMIANQCSVILGFDNTNELTAVQDLAEKENQFVISMYADTKELISKNVFSLQPPADFLVQKLRSYIGEKYKIKNVLIFNTIDRSDLVHYRQAFQSWFKEINASVTSVNLLERPLRLEEARAEILKDIDIVDTIVLDTRALTASLISDLIHEMLEDKKKILFLATENLGSSSLPVFFNALKHKDVEVYFSRHNAITDPDKKYQNFVSEYKNKYGENPAVISGYAFDTVKYLGVLYKSISSAEKENIISPEQMLKAAKDSTFSGITGITFLPGPKIDHTKSFIVKVTSDGYAVAENL